MAKRNMKSQTDTRQRTALSDIDKERLHMIGPAMSFAAAEAYKLLRTNLVFSFSGEESCRTVGVTSSVRDEGKSLTAINLAYTLAETQKRVLLIGCDMRLPTLSKRLDMRATPGLSNLLVGMSSVNEAIQMYTTRMEDDVEVRVEILVSGDIPPNPSELLSSERMEKLLGMLREHYDYIILDLPPVTAVSDAVIACKLVDGMVIVVRSDHAERTALSETIRQLRQVNGRILGFVFNGAGGSGTGYYKGKKNYYYKKKNYYRNYYYQNTYNQE